MWEPVLFVLLYTKVPQSSRYIHTIRVHASFTAESYNCHSTRAAMSREACVYVAYGQGASAFCSRGRSHNSMMKNEAPHATTQHKYQVCIYDTSITDQYTQISSTSRESSTCTLLRTCKARLNSQSAHNQSTIYAHA